ncbi:MAG: LysR family transcriptional regulator [Peptococcaceae bacterium]|nr:LysR family transcriptional regulator [Peptococcaceae bacterium]
MTIQQLKYIVSVVENGTITEAAKKLYISQPSLSNAIKDIEEEVGITIFIRSRAGIVVTPEGMEFVGYARQVLRQMELLEDKYISHTPGKIRFGVSSPQYVFSTNAFVDIVEEFGKERFEFILHETTVHQILDDVKNRFSDLGIIYISRENEQAMRKTLEENKLSFYELFTVKPQVFVRASHPLAEQSCVQLEELQRYPRINFMQGKEDHAHFSDERYGDLSNDKSIRITDTGSLVNLLLGTDAYTISNGFFPRYLQGTKIVGIPLAEDEVMSIGYILSEKQELSELGRVYIDKLKQYGEPNT